MKRREVIIGAAALSASRLARRALGASLPETLSFPSHDGKTMLVGYLFHPEESSGRCPAMVLLHGRGGPYSILAHGVYDATTLTQRHQKWARFWASQGYRALIVDSFGPRGYPAGFAAHTYDQRPPEINEVTIRPLDAYGGLAYLQSRDDVMGDKVALHGWSNGGSTVLSAMADTTLASAGLTPEHAFRAGLAFYPGCGLQDRFAGGYHPYGPVRILIGTNDDEVSLSKCQAFVAKSRADAGSIEMTVYPDATHDFDDPGTKRQSVPANADADADARQIAARFIAEAFA